MRHIYQTTVREVGNGCVVGANGKTLTCIGSLPVQAGDTVYTDGRVVYGHVPIKAGGLIISEDKEGIPVLSRSLNGFFTLNGQYKNHDWSVSNGESNFFLNNEKHIFDFRSLPSMVGTTYLTYMVDAENAEEENSFYYAGRTTESTQNIYEKVEFDNLDGERAFSFSKKVDTFNIRVCKVTRGEDGNYTAELLKTIQPVNLREAFNDEFFSRWEYCKLDYFITQLLDFRFVDKEGNYEFVVACFAKGYGDTRINYSSSVGTLETVYNDEIEYVGDSDFFYTTSYRFRLTRTASTIYVPASKTESYPVKVDLDNVYFVAKIKSDGTSEILQRKIRQPGASASLISSCHTVEWQASPMGGSWIFIPEWPISGAPTGKIVAIKNMVLPMGTDPNVVTLDDLWNSAGTWVMESYDVTCQDLVYDKSEYTVDAININQNGQFRLKLNDDYHTSTNIFNLYDVRKGEGGNSEAIASTVHSVFDSQLIEPAVNSTFNVNGWNVIKTTDMGAVSQERASGYPGFYQPHGGQYTTNHMIPHASFCELKSGHLLSLCGDMNNRGGIYRLNNGNAEILDHQSCNENAERLDYKSCNIRFNKSKRVRRLKK